MKEVYKGLWVGDDGDVDKAREKNWIILHCCKDGDYSHRSLLKYETQAAPKGDEYLVAKRGREMYLNLIDPETDKLVSSEAVDAGIKFARDHLEKGDHVLVHCNQGNSRGPSVAMLLLYELGKLPSRSAFSSFRRLYPMYAPSNGMKIFVRKRLQI
jgi:predicted protein tyrosine phosphatase